MAWQVKELQEGSVVKGTGCSSREHWVDPQLRTWISQSSVTLVSGIMVLSYSLWGHFIHMVHRQASRDTLVHITKNK